MDLSTLLGGSSSNSLLDGYVNTVNNTINGVQVWTIIAVILSIAAAVLVYFLYIKSTTGFKGFWQTVKDFLSFKTMCIEALAKMFYVATTVYLVLTSINNLILLGADGVLPFFSQLLLYPLVARFAYEFIMVIVKIWQNTTIIAENTGKKPVAAKVAEKIEEVKKAAKKTIKKK